MNIRSTRRRLTLSVLVIFAIVAIFSARLVDIQIVSAAELDAKSLDKRSVPVVTYGVRGEIVDTNGVVLADSVDRYDITAAPKYAKPITRVTEKGKVTFSVADLVNELAVATGDDATKIMASISKDPNSNFAYVSKAVSLDKLTAVKALKIPWVYEQLHPSRTYPNGAVAGNLVGFIGTDGPQAGLERGEDTCLASTNCESTYEKGRDGVRLPGSTVTTKDPSNGGVLKLTIDSDFQWYVQQQIATQAEAIGADWATAIVVRVKDGHLMAVADYPSVDPNDVNGVPNTALGSLAFSTPYEPGSTFKAMTAAMLIDAGVISQTTPVVVPGRLYFPNGQYIKDVFAHRDLRYTTTGILANSSNTGISLLSDKLDPTSRFEYMQKFGLGEKTAVSFPGESGGVLPPTSQWDQITKHAVAFGQGVSATSAQVAAIYQTLGNGGMRMPLTLVEGCQLPDGTITQLPDAAGTRVVSESAANQTVQMLENVVTQGPLRSALQIPGYRIAAKTGTAQVAAAGVYTDDRVISVAGLVPAENPEYAIVVTFGKPDTMKTSAGAAPTFKNIVTQTIKTFRIEPSTEPAPNIPLTW
jgi:cell division protein FtsI (penicillin-binding protein 3)